MNPKYRVLVIDESAFIRQYLTEILNNCGELEIVATAGDPVKARELIKKQNYDVITLDIGMNDGNAILNELMRENPIPVVLINSSNQSSGGLVKAFTSNVVDFITKPSFGFKEGMQKLNDEIVSKVIAAAKSKLAPKTKPGQNRLPDSIPNPVATGKFSKRELIVIGASTGGTVALTQVFRDLDITLPGIIIIQHMPAMFTEAFAQSLDQIGQIRVREAHDNDQIYPGLALIVPGGKALAVSHSGQELTVKLHNPDPNSRYNPSIDFTMSSVAAEVGANSMGIILTGMGDDGARGLRAMYDCGSYTIAQDEKSSIIYGMPKKALEFGGVKKIVPLDELAAEMKHWAFT